MCHLLVHGISWEFWYIYLIEKHVVLMLFRLEISRYQLSYLIKKVNDLARTGSLYKQKLQRRCSDLEMAEAEVRIWTHLFMLERETLLLVMVIFLVSFFSYEFLEF